MPRIARIVITNVPHHVFNRGHRKRRIFNSEDDFLLFLKLLREAGKHHNVKIIGYCLMPNHFHVIAVPHAKDSLAKAFEEVKRKYTMAQNIKYQWTGSLWECRFHSSPVDPIHFLFLLRYIELNPVRAKIVKYAEEYPWSSARAHVHKRADRHLDLAEIPELQHGIDWVKFLKAEDDPKFINAVEQHIRTGRPLGSKEFINRLEMMIGRNIVIRRAGRKPISNDNSKPQSDVRSNKNKRRL